MQLGDQIERVTNALRIPSCGGCQRRKALLNREGRWTKPWETPPGWSMQNRWANDSRAVALFVHTSGKRIIWEVVDGAYRRSYGYCCESMKVAAEQQFAKLCH